MTTIVTSHTTDEARRVRITRFVDEYVKDFNATAAYLRAFPHVSARSANAGGSRLKRDPEVQAMIAGRTKGRMVLHDITIERVVMELGRLAFFDPRKVVQAISTTTEGDDGAALTVTSEKLIALTQLDEDTARAVSEIEVQKNGAIRLKFANKEGALTTLIRALSPTPHANNPTHPVAAGASLVDHDTLDDGEIDAIIAEADAMEEDEEEVLEMGEDGELIENGG